MLEIETALLREGTKQVTTQRETSLCVTFIVMYLLRDALKKFYHKRITDNQTRREIDDVLFRFGKLIHEN